MKVRMRTVQVRAAAAAGNLTQLQDLLTTHPDLIDTPNKYGCTLMYAAAGNGRVLAIETLVRFGSKAIDTPDDHGRTPLYTAVFNGQVPVIEALVRLGSKAIDTPNNDGSSPLGIAVYQSRHQVVKVLKALGASVDIPTKGFTTKKIELLRATMPEDEVLEVRYRVHFAESLVHRLLFELDRHVHPKASVAHSRTQL